ALHRRCCNGLRHRGCKREVREPGDGLPVGISRSVALGRLALARSGRSRRFFTGGVARLCVDASACTYPSFGAVLPPSRSPRRWYEGLLEPGPVVGGFGALARQNSRSACSFPTA